MKTHLPIAHGSRDVDGDADALVVGATLPKEAATSSSRACVIFSWGSQDRLPLMPRPTEYVCSAR